jgi:hypothetical protein
VTLAVYVHHEPLTFPGYLDLDTGRTLEAEPGRTYDIAPAGGTSAPDIPGPWFTAAAGAEGEEPAGEDEDDGTAGGEGEPAVPPFTPEDETGEQ